MKLPTLPRREVNVHLSMGGVALLLVLLILITPALENGVSTPSGSIFSRAELFVDYLGNSSVALYVESYGHVRFSSITLGVNTSLGNTTAGTFPSLHWNYWQNATDRIDFSIFVQNTTEFAINATTVYASPPPVTYTTSYGSYGFVLTPTASGLVMTVIPFGNLPSTQTQTWPVTDLPQALVLSERSSSGVKA